MKIVYVVTDEETINNISRQGRLVDGAIIELRVDLMNNTQLDNCITLCRQLDLNVLVTYRTREEGGNGNASHYKTAVNSLLTKYIDWIDIELKHLMAIDIKSICNVGVIVSAHTYNLNDTLSAIETMSALPSSIKRKSYSNLNHHQHLII